jgi:hypothetical protein
MSDQEGNKHVRTADETIIRAINEVASTKQGRIFFRWLATRCFQNRSTIVGDQTSHEINPLGSVANAYVQRLYQDIHRVIKPEIRIKIEYPHVDTE